MSLEKPVAPVPPDESYETGTSTHELPWSVIAPSEIHFWKLSESPESWI